MTGSAGQQRVPKAFLESLEIPVPPLDEQRRIVGILDKAEELRAKRRTAIALLDQLPQAIFLEMFGDPAHNPKGWPRFPFQELADRRLGKMLDKKKQSGEEPLPYLGNANVQWFRFELKNLQRMTFTERERSLLRLEPGDVLICEGGEPGRCAVWTGELQGCYFQKAIHRARVDRSKLEPEYVVHCLYALTQHDGLKDYVTVATIAHLTGEKLDILPFPVPPINLQRRFAARVEKIRHSKAIEESALAQSDALFASLQHRAFVGVL
jgi:type I restriction enzyme, S subunit